MNQCVIFDMDGVIIDSEHIHMACEREIFRLTGISVTDEEHHKMVGTNDNYMWTQLDKRHNLPIPVSDIIVLKKKLFLEYLKREPYIKPIAGVIDLIYDLFKENIPMALASSSHKDQIDVILNKFSINHFFKTIVSGNCISNCKPHPEIFLKTIDAIGVSPGATVVIEDSENGVLAAKSAKMKCIGYRNQNSGIQDLSKADLIVSSFNELSVDVIKGM